MMSKFKVESNKDEGRVGFIVEFPGPKDTPYEDGVWQVRVELPSDYPFRSPSIGFQNRIYHPNVDENSGSVCLDVINQAWSPMFNLVNVFDQFLPQLLSYPNPSDPLNGEAASLLMRDPKAYEDKVRDKVAKYAKPVSSPSQEHSSKSLSFSSSPDATAPLQSNEKCGMLSFSRDTDEMSVLSEQDDNSNDDLLADMEL